MKPNRGLETRDLNPRMFPEPTELNTGSRLELRRRTPSGRGLPAFSFLAHVLGCAAADFGFIRGRNQAEWQQRSQGAPPRKKVEPKAQGRASTNLERISG